MLVELSISPLGRGTHISGDLAEILKTVDDSGLRYKLTPSGTCIEGDWDDVMGLIKLCHEKARSMSDHVLTTLRIEDEAGASDKLNENIKSVERAAGRKLQRC
ncbi:MAG TPA: MTH1187 family thiamine-binding protein [Blastocatellia bacterium]|nr:MTH1187 family thiamine-binding protein [Blastocatellia bacterium]